METRLAREVEALREGCGLVFGERTEGGDALEMLGADRRRFLNAYVTCEVKSLEAGQGTYGYFTSAQGRILADVVVLAHDDRLWLELPPGQRETIANHLRRYLIADRVEMRPLAGVLPLALVGPGAAPLLTSPVAGDPPAALPGERWGNVRTVVSGVEVVVQRGERRGVPALTLWAPAAEAAALRDRLLDRRGAGAVPPVAVSIEALDVVRVEAGVPRFGLDFGPQNFPQETGADDAVSYTKGCYLGQEVVARIHYRGGVQKALRGLVLEAGALPPSGTALLYEGREAGAVGSAVHSVILDRPIALAILHRRAAEPGTRLDLAGGGSAEVRSLPFVPTATGP